MPSVCILIGVRLLFLLLLVLELLLLFIASCSSADSNPSFGFFVIGLPEISWPPTLSMGISDGSSENSSVSILVVLLPVVVEPFCTSLVRDPIAAIIWALFAPSAISPMLSSQPLFPTTASVPLTTKGVDIAVDVGVDAAAPMLA